MSKVRTVVKEEKKAPPVLGKNYKDPVVEGFDSSADAFSGGGRPPDDGRHVFVFKSPKKGGDVQIIAWDEKDEEGRPTGAKVYDFSLRYEAEIIDKDDPDFGKRVWGKWDTFTRERRGVKTYAVATILAKIGVTPSGRKKQDIDKLASLLAKGFQLAGVSRWKAELEYDDKAGAEYKLMQNKVPFLVGMNNFPENGDGKAATLTTVDEETEITAKVKGKERTFTFEKGWPLRTFAELVRFEEVE